MEAGNSQIDSSTEAVGPLAREIVPDLANFKKYTRTKQRIAYEIRALMEFLHNHFGDREAEECRELMVKLTEDRFTLAVVGQFKRGKSSLMNAIMGQDLLPTGILPLTSAITMLQYGPQARLLIYKQGLSYPLEAPLRELPEFVTEKGNPGNVKGIIRACVELPIALLRRGLEFVDTPGIGSAIEANTLTTQRFLPKSDAVIFVTSVDSPLTRAESDFLQQVREHVRKIFFVVNKIDLISGDQWQEVLHFVEERIAKVTQAERIKIFPVSSLNGLQAKLAGAESGYRESGLSALEEALSEFLSKEKSSTFLLAVLDKLDRLLLETIQQVRLIKTAAELPQNQMADAQAALRKAWQQLAEARRQKLALIHDELNRQMQAAIEERAAGLFDELEGKFAALLDQELDHSSLRLAYFAVQSFAAGIAAEVRRGLVDYVSEQRKLLAEAFEEMLRQSWSALEDNLHEITQAAGAVLGVQPGVDSSLNGELQSGIPQPHPQPTPLDFEWRPQMPTWLCYVPVLLIRSALKRRFQAQLSSLMEGCLRAVSQAVNQSIDAGLMQVEAELKRRAGVVEARILQAMKGRKLARRIDGRWQLAELDAAELSQQVDELQAIAQRIALLQSETLFAEPLPDAAPRGAHLPSASTSAALDIPPPLAPATAQKASGAPEDLARDLQTRGCPACEAMFDAAHQFFADWQYALANQEKAQRAHADSLGFCPLHTWQFAAVSSPQGLSQGLPKLMERLSGELEQFVAGRSKSGAELAKTLTNNSKACQVCRLLKNIEKSFIEDLAGYLQTERGRKAYAASQGLCLRHLDLLLGDVRSNELTDFLIGEAARRFAEIAEDMQNYALKRDAREGYALNQDEKDAWWRGLVHLVGDKKVAVGWDESVEL